MLFAYLSREARTWQQIFAHYVLPTTHFSEISIDMLLLIGFVMEGKEVYFPWLIRRGMWRVHIRGLLPFATMVTRMVELDGAPWRDDDAIPPPPDEDDREPPSRRRSRARSVVEAARPSSSTAAAVPLPPPAPKPTCLLV
ncbi:hypothetical protein AHAS_Ahas20G0260500 [Arachis hypogaea]